jgi:hypothetical protein
MELAESCRTLSNILKKVLRVAAELRIPPPLDALSSEQVWNRERSKYGTSPNPRLER